MNDAEYEIQKARILAIATPWFDRLGLAYWDIAHCMHRGPIDDCEEVNDAALARCHVQWQYLHACIHWNLALVQEHNGQELESILVHECMHIFLHELRGEPDDWMDHEERVAQMLAKAFIWVRNAEKIFQETVAYAGS